MSTPFPGMDPFLEQRGLWEEVHTRLIVAIADFLTPLVAPRYQVAVEQRAYFLGQTDDFTGKPDVLIMREPAPAPYVTSFPPQPLVATLPVPEEVVERYLEIRSAAGDVVTVIELLSPANKTTADGRAAYLRKRGRVLASRTHLVEIDLVRSSAPLPLQLPTPQRSPYRIVVSRAPLHPQADVYLFGLRQPIPVIPIPLGPATPAPELPLNTLVHDLYDRARLDLRVDYAAALSPALVVEDAEWVAALLRG